MRLVLLVQRVIAMWREKSSLTGLLIFINIITGSGTGRRYFKCPDRTVRREYATTINFPCLITLGLKMDKWDRICLVYLTDTVVNRTCQV